MLEETLNAGEKITEGSGKTSTATRLLCTCFPSWCLSVMSDSPLVTKIGPSSACAAFLKALMQDIRRHAFPRPSG